MDGSAIRTDTVRSGSSVTTSFSGASNHSAPIGLEHTYNQFGVKEENQPWCAGTDGTKAASLRTLFPKPIQEVRFVTHLANAASNKKRIDGTAKLAKVTL